MAESNTEPELAKRLGEGISYFENMLEMMPEDRTALEFLIMAYEHTGERDRYEAMLVRLVQLLVREDERDALAGLLPRLQECLSHDAKVMALRVARITSAMPELIPETPKGMTAEDVTASEAKAAIAAEVALVDMLRDGGVIDPAAASELRSHLEATPVNGRVFLISAIQILEKENVGVSERALEFLADRFAAPPVPLAAYEIDKSLWSMWPADLLRIHGVAPFAKMGKFCLVAMLNPSDSRLKGKLEAVTPCKFFLADAASVSDALAKAFGNEIGG